MNEYIKVDGIGNICSVFQLTIENEESLNPPEPKSYTVDIPGGNGTIDLTESLTGDVVYNQREQVFKTFYVGKEDTWEQCKTKLLNALHGRRLSYKLSFDPGYTYVGRFDVSSCTRLGRGFRAGEFEIKITADPYKTKDEYTYKLNATGGKSFTFSSGRRPVHPVIECSNPVYITWDGDELIVPAGTYRLNDVVFRQGNNEIYINTAKIWLVVWLDLAADGEHAMTWDTATQYRWDDIQRMGTGQTDTPQAWSDISDIQWSSLSQKKWKELDYRREALPENTAYLTYRWEDL